MTNRTNATRVSEAHNARRACACFQPGVRSLDLEVNSKAHQKDGSVATSALRARLRLPRPRLVENLSDSVSPLTGICASMNPA
jgi:hypothetical protein